MSSPESCCTGQTDELGYGGAEVSDARMGGLEAKFKVKYRKFNAN